MLVQYTAVVPLKYERPMKLLKEVKDEDWATFMNNVEQALGIDARQMLEHRIAVLEAMALRYQLEAEEDILENDFCS
jgi:hypothetical protein